MSLLFKVVPAALLVGLSASTAYAQPRVEIRHSTLLSANANYEGREDDCRNVNISFDVYEDSAWHVNWSDPQPSGVGAIVRLYVSDRCTPNKATIFSLYAKVPNVGDVSQSLSSASLDVDIANAQRKYCWEDTPGHFQCEDALVPLVLSADWRRTGAITTESSNYREPVENGWNYTQDTWSNAPAQATFSIASEQYSFELSDQEAGLSRGLRNELRYRTK